MEIHKHAFRQYDIRGKVDQELPIDECYRLACALATYILEQHPQAKKIIIARDGRTHSPAIHRQVVQAFFDAGFVVHDTGVCPTPVMYFALHTHDYDAGVMITASHNGPEYNGLKICLKKQSVWGPEIQKVYALYLQRAKPTVSAGVSRYQRVNIQQEYVMYMAEHFADLRNYGTSIVFDCGNGAVGAILRDVIDAVGLLHTTIICEEVDGTYPHHPANPVEPENMQMAYQELVEQSADLAVGFDGDGDRMAVMTREGELLGGDRLLALFARDILHDRKGPIVYDGKCSLIVAETVERCGAQAIRSPSGHSIIKTAMHTHKALLGGELSCHFFFADSYFGFDDGIYACLRLLRILLKTGKSLAVLVAEFPLTYSTPELLITCAEEQKKDVMQKVQDYFIAQPALTLCYDDGVRFEHQDGWGLIRASNTQAALCVRCESRTQQGLTELKKWVYTVLSENFSDTELKNLR